MLSAGDLDPTFGVGGRASAPRDGRALHRHSIVLPDDKVLIAGQLVAVHHEDRDAYVLQRFNADGSRDTGYGTGGTVTGYFSDDPLSDSEINEMVAQPDGKVLALGYSRGQIMARFNADGTLDTSFGGGDGMVEEFTGAIALAPDGKIVTVGSEVITRYTANGSVDATFGTGGKIDYVGGVEEIRVLPDNRILIGAGRNVRRFNADGSVDTTFGDAGVTTLPGSDRSMKIALLGGGRFLVATTVDDSFAVVRVNGDGTIDDTFAGGRAFVRMSDFLNLVSIDVDDDGNAVLIGETYHGIAVTRITPGGQVDATFGRVTTDAGTAPVFVRGGGIQSNGNIVAAGSQNTPITDTDYVHETFVYRLLAEDNGVPTPITLDSASRKLSVPGTGGNDLIAVYEEDTILRAYRNGFGRVFDVADVESLAISGRGGDDVILATTSTVPAHATGGAGADRIVGGAAGDTLQGNIGPDRIDGGDGADAIDAGAGNDAVRGGTGNDTLTGGHGDDELRGNAGADAYDGGTGNNFVVDIGIRDLTFTRSTGLLKYFDTTNTDDDLLIAPDGSGGLAVTAGDETDTIPIAAVSSIDLNGNGGNDRLRLDPAVTIPALLNGGVGRQYGPGGADTLVGGAGNDTLIGHGDEDLMEGSAGNDTFVALGDNSVDTVDGGAGTDSAEADDEDDLLNVETVA